MNKKPIWSAMRTGGVEGINSDRLPGIRGRAVLVLEGDIVEGDPVAVHFSWRDNSFCLRDYINQREARQDQLDLTPEAIWRMAKHRVNCTGELFVPVENVAFWTAKLAEITQQYRAKRVSVATEIQGNAFFSRLVGGARESVEEVLAQTPGGSAGWSLDHDEKGRPVLVLMLTDLSGSATERFATDDLDGKDQAERLKKLKAKLIRAGQGK